MIDTKFPFEINILRLFADDFVSYMKNTFIHNTDYIMIDEYRYDISDESFEERLRTCSELAFSSEENLLVFKLKYQI